MTDEFLGVLIIDGFPRATGFQLQFAGWPVQLSAALSDGKQISNWKINCRTMEKYLPPPMCVPNMGLLRETAIRIDLRWIAKDCMTAISTICSQKSADAGSMEELFSVSHSALVLSAEATYAAVTDRGTRIPLFHYQAVVLPKNDGSRPFDPGRDVKPFLSYLEDVYLNNLQIERSDLHRLRELDPTANCHGWIYADGEFGINHSYVDLILDEHGYVAVAEPAAGDIAIYRSNGEIVHSGLVRESKAPGSILVESKWGPFGVFLHKAETHFGARTFYSTQRQRHTLDIARISQG